MLRWNVILLVVVMTACRSSTPASPRPGSATPPLTPDAGAATCGSSRPPRQGAGLEVHRLPRGTPAYFADRIGAKLASFAPDGRYTRSSFGIADRGRWRQLADGRLCLISERELKGLSTSALAVAARTTDDLAHLRELRRRVRTVLARPGAPVLSRREVRELMTVVRARGPDAIVSAFPGIRTVGRRELEELVAELDAHERDPERSVFYLTAYRHRGVVVLVEDDDEAVDLAKLRETIDESTRSPITLAGVDKAGYEAAAGAHRSVAPRPASGPTVAATRPSRARPRPERAVLPRTSAHYFALHVAHSSYLELRVGGRYRKFQTSHFGVGDSDRGRWTQEADGRLRLASEIDLRNLEVGPLQIRLTDHDDLARVRALQPRLRAFLAKERRARLDAAAVRSIMQYVSSIGYTISVVKLQGGALWASRSDLEKLLEALPRYLADPEKNVFRYHALRYRDRVFLLDDDGDLTPEELAEEIDREAQPLLHFASIDRREFARGSTRPEPFKYYPKMNKGCPKKPGAARVPAAKCE